MRFQIARRVNEMIASIIATHILVLDPVWSLVKNLMTKMAPTISGARHRRATGTYHQWMYSFKRQ